MQTNRKLRMQLRLQGGIFIALLLLVVGLLAWLSTRYVVEADWTAAGRHTLSEASSQVLDELQGPLRITSFSRAELSPELRQRSRELVARYQRHRGDIELIFVDPDQRPQQVREWGVQAEGELVLEYMGQRENLRTLGEQALTNAIMRLLRDDERKVYFITGHGERRFDRQANHDLSQWAEQLQQRGFDFQQLNLSSTPEIPADASALVLASPQLPLHPGEVALLVDYLEGGGNLLWLSEPERPEGLAPLKEALDLHFVPGTLIDPTGQRLGIDNPAIVLVPEYPAHPVSQGLEALTLFPIAHAIQQYSDSAWQSFPLLNTLPNSWAETGPLDGEVRFDDTEDTPGPLTIGLLLERSIEGTDGIQAQQRVAVLGDGDFLSNSFLGNGANQELGDRLLNWLSHDDRFIAIAPRTAPDTRLDLERNHIMLIGFGFLVALPLLLLASGLTIWWRRRRR